MPGFSKGGDIKEQQGSIFCGKRSTEAHAVRAFTLSRSRNADLLRSSFLEMTRRCEALRCRARLNLLTPPGLYPAHKEKFQPALE